MERSDPRKIIRYYIGKLHFSLFQIIYVHLPIIYDKLAVIIILNLKLTLAATNKVYLDPAIVLREEISWAFSTPWFCRSVIR